MHSHHTVHVPLLTTDTVFPFDPWWTSPVSSQKHFFLPAPCTLPPSHTRSLLTYYIRNNSPSYPRYTSPFLFQRHSPHLSPDTLSPFLPLTSFPLLTPDMVFPSYPGYTSFLSLPAIARHLLLSKKKVTNAWQMLPRYEEGWTCREKLTRHIVVWISTTSRDCSNIFSHKTL